MNPADSQPGDFEVLSAEPAAVKVPDARLVINQRDGASVRARALQIIDEYDRLLQRLVEMLGDLR